MEKPGISAYNKLKGSVMEFGYVTESGDKIRVRSMPADGLGPVDIRKHLDYVEREYVEEERRDVNKLLYSVGLKKKPTGLSLPKDPNVRSKLAKEIQRRENDDLGTSIGNSLGSIMASTAALKMAKGKHKDKLLKLGKESLVKATAKKRMKERLSEETHYTRRETLKQKLLEAIRSYGVE